MMMLGRSRGSSFFYVCVYFGFCTNMSDWGMGGVLSFRNYVPHSGKIYLCFLSCSIAHERGERIRRAVSLLLIYS